jgi:DNA-binding transcriptional regulator YhcF (GntR family)
MNENLIDCYQPEISFQLLESSDPGNSSILGKVRGQFFVPDGNSRNNRHYPKALWQRVLENTEVKRRLNDRVTFGAIGHDQILDDAALREGKFSHIVTSLQINESNKGIGEADILNTPTGRILYTFLEAGAKLYVSSRATGKLKEGVKKNGMPVVDEDTYSFNTFDFVIDPGFKQANPQLVESVNQLNKIFTNNTNEKNGVGKMTDQVDASKEALITLSKENSGLREDMESATTEIEALKTQTLQQTAKLESLETDNSELTEKVVVLEKYSELGTIEEIETLLETSIATQAELKEYKAIDPASVIVEALEKSSKLLEDYNEIGSVEEINKMITVVEGFKTKIDAFGTVEEIAKMCQVFETLIAQKEEAQTNEDIKTLAEELKVSVDRITKVYGKLTKDEIKEMFAGVEEEKTEEEKRLLESRNRYKRNDKGEPIIPEAKTKDYEKSAGERLMESMGGTWQDESEHELI